jgi:DNA-binding transcriptional ArsR family regulator
LSPLDEEAALTKARTRKITISVEPPSRPVEAPGCGASELVEIGAIVDCAYEAARLLKLLANEKRLVILCFLATRGEMPVGALVEALGLSQSALSQHLARLRRDGLVRFRRESQILHYRLADPRVVRVLGVLDEIFCARPLTVDSRGPSRRLRYPRA